MRPLIIAVVCLTVLGAFSSVVSAEQRKFIIDAEFYRVCGDISGKTSLADSVWSGLTQRKSQAKKGSLTLFTRANLTVADVQLKADEGGWTWDGEYNPPNDGEIELIARPRVLINMGERFGVRIASMQPFGVRIASMQPIDYLERRPDGLFELKRSNVLLGIGFDGTVDEGKRGRLVLRNLTIMANFVVKRRPIEGVTLDVGAPIIEEHAITITVKPGRYYGLLFSTEGQGGLIVRLRVDPQDEA